MNPPVYRNPDQAQIHRFMAQPDSSLRFDGNPMALAMRTSILAVDATVGRIELAFDPDPLFIQGTNVLQGGAVTAMLDFAMAFALLAQLEPGQSCATVNLTTAFLRPAPQGRYVAIGELERRGKGLAFTRAELLREQDRVRVATATSTLALLV
jgi:uncharacterized protein (TIGR00369 family)